MLTRGWPTKGNGDRAETERQRRFYIDEIGIPASVVNAVIDRLVQVQGEAPEGVTEYMRGDPEIMSELMRLSEAFQMMEEVSKRLGMDGPDILQGALNKAMKGFDAKILANNQLDKRLENEPSDTIH